jgi:hypothetical protein
MTENPKALAKGAPVASLDVLRAVPEEELWLQSQESPETRRAHRHDVRDFPTKRRFSPGCSR